MIKKHKKNFLIKKVEIITERLFSDLMIRPTRSSGNSFPVSSLILSFSREI